MSQTKMKIIVDADTQKAKKNLDKVGSAVKAAFGATAVILATKKFISVMKDFSDAAAVQELAVTRLGAALSVTGQDTNGALKELEDYASALQGVTVVGDEVSLGLMQTAINMGLSADQSKVATKQAIALSRAYGIDLNTAMIGVVNTMQGQTSTLTRYIPSLKAAGNATERMAILNDEANKAWAIATAEVDTAAGALAQYQNTLGDTSELIGQLVNNSLTPWRKELNKVLIAMNEGIKLSVQLSTALAHEADGTATITEKITLYKQEIEDLNAKMAVGTALGNVNRKEAEARIVVLNNLIEMYKRAGEQQASGEARTRAAAEAAAKAAEDAAAAAENAAADAAQRAAAEASAAAAKKTALENIAAMEAENAAFIKQMNGENALAIAKSQAEELAGIQALKDADNLRHEIKMAKIQEELDAYASMAAGVGQIFSTLIQAQMAGEETLTQEKKDNITKLFKMQKAANIAQVLLDSASAIMRQYKDMPIWLAVPASIVTAAVAGAQIAAINATPSPAANMAAGSAPGGYIVPGGYENDTYPINAKSGERVHIERTGSDQGQPIQVVLVIDGETLGAVNTRLIRNRKTIITMGDIAA